MKPFAHSEPHQLALGRMRAGEWDSAAETLANLGPDSHPWVANDLAVCLHQLRRLGEAVEVLRPWAEKDPPALCRFNLMYFEKAFEIENNFDPHWSHHDHDGAPCPQPRPKVSVIVRTHRRTDLLAQALRSLREQTFQDFEAIVVNDGGDPAAEGVVAQSGIPMARYVMMPHRDRVFTLNTGLEMAHGEYVTGLDDDDVAFPRHLEILAGFLDRRPEVHAVYPGFRRVVLAEGGRPDRPLSSEDRKGDRQVLDRLFSTNPVPAIMMMIRRECLAEAGRFCPALDLGEDWEMWLRLKERFLIEHVPEVTAEIRERPGDANITNRRLRQKYVWDNTLLYLHRGIILASAPRRPELARAYTRGMEALDCWAAAAPEKLGLINLRGLWEMTKPYAWFADQGRWLESIGEARLAARFYGMAASLAPLEPKTWSGLVRSRLRLARKS